MPLTREFYERTKLYDILNDDPPDPAPITHTHVFSKEYLRMAKVELPRPSVGGEFYGLLYSRESSRAFSGGAIHLETVGKILYSCGKSDTRRTPEKRTYPSAGARFPVETYLICFNVAGIDRGAYHYDPEKHGLDVLLKKDLRAREKEFCSPYVENSAAVLVFTTVISRSEVKYGVKSYPYSLIEAGHMCQNMQLACTKFGVQSCPIGGFVNDTVSKVLDLTENELPIYTMCLGTAAAD